MAIKDYTLQSRDELKVSGSSTNCMLKMLCLEIIKRCRPFPITGFHFVDALDFKSEARKDIALNHYKEEDGSAGNWIEVVWRRGALTKFTKREASEQDLYPVTSVRAKTEVTISFYSTAYEWLEALQELFIISPFTESFKYVYNNVVCSATFVDDYTVGEITHVDRNNAGNLVTMQLKLSVSFPIFKYTGIGSEVDFNGEGKGEVDKDGNLIDSGRYHRVDRIKTKLAVVNHQVIKDYKESGKSPEVNYENVVFYDDLIAWGYDDNSGKPFTVIQSSSGYNIINNETKNLVFSESYINIIETNAPGIYIVVDFTGSKYPTNLYSLDKLDFILDVWYDSIYMVPGQPNKFIVNQGSISEEIDITNL